MVAHCEGNVNEHCLGGRTRKGADGGGGWGKFPCRLMPSFPAAACIPVAGRLRRRQPSAVCRRHQRPPVVAARRRPSRCAPSTASRRRTDARAPTSLDRDDGGGDGRVSGHGRPLCQRVLNSIRGAAAAVPP